MPWRSCSLRPRGCFHGQAKRACRERRTPSIPGALALPNGDIEQREAARRLVFPASGRRPISTKTAQPKNPACSCEMEEFNRPTGIPKHNPFGSCPAGIERKRCNRSSNKAHFLQTSLVLPLAVPDGDSRRETCSHHLQVGRCLLLIFTSDPGWRRLRLSAIGGCDDRPKGNGFCNNSNCDQHVLVSCVPLTHDCRPNLGWLRSGRHEDWASQPIRTGPRLLPK